MTNERMQALQEDETGDIGLTSEEVAEGWHFCWEYDGLLCVIGEQPGCKCGEDRD
jgi:hypothetical protein